MVSSRFTAAERLTSLKTAILGGLCAGLISIVILMVHRGLVFGPAIALTTLSKLPELSELSKLFELFELSELPDLLMNMATLTLLVNGAIAVVSGAVFSITYRYAVRQDTNVQLHVGVVFAFTLVRGLAQVDVGSAIAQNFWPFLSACGESLLIFGLTALIINVATQYQWLLPFGDSTI